MSNVNNDIKNKINKNFQDKKFNNFGGKINILNNNNNKIVV
jgi:hypothetical protein